MTVLTMLSFYRDSFSEVFKDFGLKLMLINAIKSHFYGVRADFDS